MPTNQELIHICDKALTAVAEVKATAVRLGQLEQQMKEAESNLRALEGQIETAKKLAPQLQEVEEKLRAKRAEIAELDAILKSKNELHGLIDSKLRDFRKQISGNL